MLNSNQKSQTHFAYTVLLDVSVISIASDAALQHSFEIQKGKASKMRLCLFVGF